MQRSGFDSRRLIVVATRAPLALEEVRCRLSRVTQHGVVDKVIA